MKKLFILFTSMCLLGCQERYQKISNPNDYDAFLETSVTPTYDANIKLLEFWQAKFGNDSTQLMEMVKLAQIHTALFGHTGHISELITAEKLLKKSSDIAGRNQDVYLRALAHNYISQHRFKEAQVLLDSAYIFPDNKRETEYMLFDVAIELGEYKQADIFLGKIKDIKDFNYLIRLAKWSDHNGNLDAAIKYLEQAKQIAEARNNKGFKIWVYSNIGDFYGHAGKLVDAYNSYLECLKIEPDNVYVKRQIAWIVYSFEKNITEATRILDSLMVNHKVPDYHLLKAELAAYGGNVSEVKAENTAFLKAVANPEYGEMYNNYLIELIAETEPEKALALAEREVYNRATPETYQLLAYAQLKSGKKEVALKTMQEKVEGKTSEPKALYHCALIYKANGFEEKVATLKTELLEASFELGPITTKKIENI